MACKEFTRHLLVKGSSSSQQQPTFGYNMNTLVIMIFGMCCVWPNFLSGLVFEPLTMGFFYLTWHVLRVKYFFRYLSRKLSFNVLSIVRRSAATVSLILTFCNFVFRTHQALLNDIPSVLVIIPFFGNLLPYLLFPFWRFSFLE